MSNHLIIDGYNLLGVAGLMGQRNPNESETVRDSLIQDLGRYHQRLGHQITIVFDAWRQKGGVQRQEHRAGVTVIFSPHGEQADQVIQKMVRELKGKCVVVSSDHEVMNTARAHGAMVLRSQEFFSKLRSQVSSYTSRSTPKIDDEEMGRAKVGSKKKGNPRKLPKAQRTRLRNLKKF